MKIIYKKIGILIASATLLLGCDIGLQERFVFVPEALAEDPFGDLTAWEFLTSARSQALTDQGGIDGEQFNYMAAAIEAAGYIDRYNAGNGDVTFLLLNNNAFTGGGDVINLITGSATVAAGETPADVMARANVDVLRQILDYHTVPTYITQTDPLSEIGLNYIFQTLIPGDDGIIVMRRDQTLRVDINTSPAPLPSTATGGGNNERVRVHNYVFSNGIGHVLNDPVRNRPYPRP